MHTFSQSLIKRSLSFTACEYTRLNITTTAHILVFIMRHTGWVYSLYRMLIDNTFTLFCKPNIPHEQSRLLDVYAIRCTLRMRILICGRGLYLCTVSNTQQHSSLRSFSREFTTDNTSQQQNQHHQWLTKLSRKRSLSVSTLYEGVKRGQILSEFATWSSENMA